MAEVTAAGGAAASGPVELRSLARGGFVNLIGAVLSTLATLALTVAVTRGFDKSQAGLFFATTSLFLVAATVATLGTPTGLVYFIARFRALGRGERILPCLRRALTPVVITSIAVGLATFALAPQLAEAAFGGHPAAVGQLRILAFFVPCAALLEALLAATQGYRRMRVTVLVDRVTRSALQLVLVGAVALTGSYQLLVPAWALPYLPATVLAGFALYGLTRRAPADKPVGEPAGDAQGGGGMPTRHGESFWRFTAPRSLATIAQILVQRLGILLLVALASAAAGAVFVAATRFLTVGRLTAQALTLAAQPRLSELLARDNRAAANEMYQTATAWLVTVTWPLYLIFAVHAPSFLGVFGRGYGAGSAVLVILAVTMLVATGCGMVDIVLTMAGRTTWNLANYLLALAVNVAVNLALIPHFGVLGAAIAAACSTLVANLVPLAQIAVALRMHPFSRATLTACALAGVSFGGLPLLVRVLAGGGGVAATAGTILGALCYLAGLWRFRALLRLEALPGLSGRVKASPRETSMDFPGNRTATGAPL